MSDDIRARIEAALAGQSGAWDSLLDQFGPVVWGTLARFQSLSQTDREDLFQEVAIILLKRGLQGFQGTTEHAFRWYLKVITENEAKGHFRRQGRRLEVPTPFLGEEGSEGESDPADPAPGPEDIAVGHEALAGLRHCLQTLPLVDQRVFWLRERGRSYQEIAQTLSLNQGTIASKYNRTKEKIANCLHRAGIL